MFLPYQISINDIHSLQGYDRILVPRISQEIDEAYAILEGKARLGEDEIDGEELKKNWLPVGKRYDVFISYSHNDEMEALKLVSWLRSKGISCFIDSVYWQNCDKLLKAIDETWCKKPNGQYDYQKRNYTTSLVHAMLSMAMFEAIDHCDFAFFIKSSSTVAFDYHNIEASTYSPWIFEEVNYMTSIEKRLPKCLQSPSTRLFCREGGVLLEHEERGVPVRMKFNIPADKLLRVDTQMLESTPGMGDSFLRSLCMRFIIRDQFRGLQRR